MLGGRCMLYKTVDLFAGIGGIRRGFELTGRFKNVLSAEVDKYACITYEHLFNEDPYNDVTSNEFKQKVKKTPYDILLGGFPCQSFSIAGKKEGFKDKTRGTLFYDIAKILEETRPKAFLLENVEGLIRHEKGQTFKIILETLINELNYKIIGVSESPITGELIYDPKDFVFNSKDFGIPQNRPRVYIVGFDKTRYKNLNLLSSSYTLSKKRAGNAIYNNLHEILDYGNSEDFYLSEGYLETLKKHKKRHKGKGNGFGYIVVNAPNIKQPISNALLATGGSGKERNLIFDPQDGIGGKVVKAKRTPLNSEGIRAMTPTEWGRLQGFIGYGFVKDGIDNFSFPKGISNAQKYKQFGNSVTIPVVETIANEMVTILDKLSFENDQIIKAKADGHLEVPTGS